jgi:hypothetical protein
MTSAELSVSTSLELIRAVLPGSIKDAHHALIRMERDIDSVETYEELRQVERYADAIRALHSDVESVCQQADRVKLLAKHRCGEELARAPKAKGTRGQLIGPGIIGPSREAEPIATIAGQVGSAKRGANLQQLAAIPRDIMLAAAETLHAQGKEATPTAVIKHLRAERDRKQREISRAAASILDELDYRIGNFWEVLADVEPPQLFLTDPPYGRDAKPQYVRLADFAARKLLLGGSLFCFVGTGWLPDVMAIFSGAGLKYCWKYEVDHRHETRLYPRLNVINCTTTILWYSKGEPRPGLPITDLLPSPDPPDKSLNGWSPGVAAPGLIIEAHTKPGELILDTFAGSGAFGYKAQAMGRRWIGSDIRRGGIEAIMATSLAAK